MKPSHPPSSDSSPDEFSLEETLAEVRGIVDKMQKGVSDFDQQLALFKQGNQHIKACQEYLNQAEFKIKQLVEGKTEDIDIEL